MAQSKASERFAIVVKLLGNWGDCDPEKLASAIQTNKLTLPEVEQLKSELLEQHAAVAAGAPTPSLQDELKAQALKWSRAFDAEIEKLQHPEKHVLGWGEREKRLGSQPDAGTPPRK